MVVDAKNQPRPTAKTALFSPPLTLFQRPFLFFFHSSSSSLLWPSFSISFTDTTLPLLAASVMTSVQRGRGNLCHSYCLVIRKPVLQCWLHVYVPWQMIIGIRWWVDVGGRFLAISFIFKNKLCKFKSFSI
jgi:uncharacterized membrane protein